MYITTRNGKIVWEHGPNWPFYALILRTKLYQNPFFFTVHQDINKPKSRAVMTVYHPMFSSFYVIIVSFFSFFFKMQTNQDQNVLQQVAICQRNTNQHCIKHSEEPKYIDHKFFFQELPVENIWDRPINTIDLNSWLVHILCDFKAT